MSSDWFNAIRSGDITFVRVNANKYRGTRNKHNETGLIYAIKHNRVEIASLLIPYERNLILDGGFTALMVCALYNCVDIAVILGASGHSAVNSEMQTALMIAAERDHAKIIRIILPNEVMRRDSRDRTALMLAAISGQNKAVEMLLPHEGGYVNLHKETAFYLALYHNNISTAKILEPVEANTWCDKLVSVVGMCLSDPKTTEYIQYLAHTYPNMEKAYMDFCGQATTSKKGPYAELKTIAELRPRVANRAGVLSPLDVRTNKATLISPIPGRMSTPQASKSVNTRSKEDQGSSNQATKNTVKELERFKDPYLQGINQIRRSVEGLQTEPQEPIRSATSIPRSQKTPLMFQQPVFTPTSLHKTTPEKDAFITHSFVSSPQRIKQSKNDISTLCNEIIVSFTKSFGPKQKSSSPEHNFSRSRSMRQTDEEAKSCRSSMFGRVDQGTGMTDTTNSLHSTKSNNADAYINYNKQMQSKLLSMFNQKRDRSPGWDTADSSLLSNPAAHAEELYDDERMKKENQTLSTSLPHTTQAFEIIYDQVADNQDLAYLNMKIPLIENSNYVSNTAIVNPINLHEPNTPLEPAVNTFAGIDDLVTNSVVQQAQKEKPNNEEDKNQSLMDTIENFTQIIDDLSNENILLNRELDKFKRAHRQMHDASKVDKQTIDALKRQLDNIIRNFSEATARDIHTMKKEIARLDNSLMDAKKLEFELSRVMDDDDTEKVTDESLML